MTTKLISHSKLKELITKRNKAFEGKTDAEKRVLVAKDVLAQIKQNKFHPSTGSYLGFSNLNSDTTNLREAFLTGNILESGTNAAECSCCALGAMMMSCTLFNNNIDLEKDKLQIFKMGEAIRGGSVFGNGLTTIFSEKQLAMIEIAFERGGGSFAYFNAPEVTYSMHLKCRDFGCRFDNPKSRLRAIMNNIVKNKGEFIPE